MRPARAAILATHPVQYHVPWFQHLRARPELDVTVYFSRIPDAKQQGAGFGIPFQWDIPMLDGYAWKVAGKDAYRHLAEERPDVVILTGWHAPFLLRGLLACERLRIPRIVRGESNSMKRRPLWLRLGHRALLSRFQGFLVIGKSNEAFYRGYGIPASRLFSAPYFVDNDRFRDAAAAAIAERAELRRKWGIPDGATCFLFVGKLEPKKRILDLVSALRMGAGESNRWHLLVVGTGILMEETRALARKLNAPASFAGFLNQTELPEAYAAADCLVLPSNYGETWGLVVNEAMVCGLPAVISDRVGCGPDLVQHEETGMIFPFGDTQALRRVLSSLAEQPATLRKMGERARERVAHYSVHAAVSGTVEAVQAVLRSAH